MQSLTMSEPFPDHLFRKGNDGERKPTAEQDFTLEGIGSCSSLGGLGFQLGSRTFASDGPLDLIQAQDSRLFSSISRGANTMGTLGSMSFPSLSGTNSVDLLLKSAAAQTVSVPPYEKEPQNQPSNLHDSALSAVRGAASAPLDTRMSSARRKKLEDAAAGIKKSKKPLAKKTAKKAASKTPTKSKASVAKKYARRRAPRKDLPEVMVYTTPTDNDVLMGRGGETNKHPGNKQYLRIILERQPEYQNPNLEKNMKTVLAQRVVDFIQNEIGGRFLQKDADTGKWFIATNKAARTKCGQSMRDDHSEEARKDKREKYPAKPKKRKSKKSQKPIAARNVEQV